MKILKFGLRLWITLASLTSFFVGWIMLAHAPKPNQANSSSQAAVAPLPTLAPLPSLSQDNASNVQNQPLFSNQPQNIFRQRPSFSTGGS